MNKEPIEIFEKREFGEFISTPISFFVQEFKLLAKALLFFVGPFVLLQAILIHFFGFTNYNQSFSQIFESFNGHQPYQRYPFILQLVELGQSIMMYTVIGVYIKLYVQAGRGNFDVPEIWREVTRFFWPVLGGQILGGLMIVIGILLLILPGIYLGVVMSLLFMVIIMEELGVWKSISRAFEVIKGYWWTAFGAFIVMGIFYFLIVMLVGVIINGIFSIFGYAQIISATASVVLGFVNILLASVLALLPAFLYSNFITEKEDPVLMGRIKQISGEAEDLNIFEVKDETELSENTESQKDKQSSDDWSDLLDEEEKKNRFDDETDDETDDTDRFKPKY